jgi:hypothetical protein
MSLLAQDRSFVATVMMIFRIPDKGRAETCGQSSAAAQE